MWGDAIFQGSQRFATFIAVRLSKRLIKKASLMTIGKNLLSACCFAHNGGDKCKCISRPFLVQYDRGLDGR